MRKPIELLSHPIWAIRPEALVALVDAIKAGTFFKAQVFTSLKPRTIESKGAKVTVLPIQGILTKDDSWAGTTYNAIADWLDQAASDSKVKRVALAVDSPGGDVIGLPETASALAAFAKTKPLSAIVEGQSASAAYWLTSQANDITIAPSAELGSVGVRMMHVDLSESLKSAGINVTELHAGEFKTEWSPFHPLTEAAKEDMQQRLDTVHRQFVTDIASGRGTRARAQIRANRFGEGRMFDATQAVRHGLADSVQAPRDFYRAITRQDATEDPESSTRLHRARLELERQRL